MGPSFPFASLRHVLQSVLAVAFAAAWLVACAAAAPAPVQPAGAPPSALPTPVVSTAAPATDAAASGASDAGSAPAVSGDEGADAQAKPGVSTSEPTVAACNEQPPQDFLVRHNFLQGGAAAAQRAIQYRTDTYGYFKGFGHPGPDAQPPSTYLATTTFMDLPIKMHRKVVPALKCVEEEIKRSCSDRPYRPHALAGIRFRNTYRGGEVTNHIYGIAIDIDPSKNTCCGCVKPWNDAPACQRPAKTEYDRMAMPECWVHAFERYGFYWLGHDVLRDTMHFEFLGDPDRIVRAPASPALPVAKEGSSAANAATLDAGAPSGRP
jgi:hypothetical protein